jgi:protoporphyrinogen oxidase
VRLGVAATGIRVDADNRVTGVETSDGEYLPADEVLATPALPIIARLIEPHAPPEYVKQLRSIDYLGNVCLVLVLDRSLSNTYWLNVNASDFPYVGIIEHTNFEPPETYGGKHLVYLSKYLPTDSELYQMRGEEVLEFSIPHIQRMFPEFCREWIHDYHVWRAEYAQPIVVKHYSRLVPPLESPIEGFFVATMAQIYPEDRGTNYAIGLGRQAARQILESQSALTAT